jgi:voltage-gated potassium channel
MSRKITERNNFAWLTSALTLLLLGVSVADQLDLHVGQLVLQLGLVLALALGVWSIRTEAHWYLTRIGFTTGVALVAVAGIFLEWTRLDLIWLALLCGYLVATAKVAMEQVLFSGRVDGNKIVGAVCIYLLLGLIWTTLYLMVAELVPGSFNGLASGTWDETFPELVYFSFTTITTLGYGDISPAVPMTRFLALAEAIVGQFYIAVLVASLVGIRISRPSNDSTSGPSATD